MENYIPEFIEIEKAEIFFPQFYMKNTPKIISVN